MPNNIYDEATLIIKINDYILNKYNNEEDLSFVDHYVFQATSYFCSLLHSYTVIKEDVVTVNRCYILRSIIECMSVLAMYIEGDIPEKSKELLNEFNYIAEYNIYKKYDDELGGSVFDFEQIKANFNNTSLKYKNVLTNMSANKAERLIERSRLPFLLNDYKFDSIIAMYEPDLIEYYRLLSIISHPHDLYMTHGLIDSNTLLNIRNILIENLNKIIDKYYKNIDFVDIKTLSYDYAVVFSDEKKVNLTHIASNEKMILFDIADMIENKMNENSFTYFLKELGYFIVALTNDYIYGYTEVIKCNFKPALEMMALDYYTAKMSRDIKDKYLADLISIHTRCSVYRALENKELLEQEYLKAFMLVKDKWGMDFDKFKKHFASNLGFSRERLSINSLVKNFIDAMYNKESYENSTLRMLYDEAQLLSHANGYMITSNFGAFTDCENVLRFIDTGTVTALKLYLIIAKFVNIANDDHNLDEFIKMVEIKINKFIETIKEKYNK